MKRKLAYLILILFCNLQLLAQSVSISLVQVPCNASGPDGILSATVVGLTPPYDFYWTFNSQTITQSGVTTATSTLNNYPGGNVYLYVTSSAGTASDQFGGQNLPFDYQTTTTAASCPNLGSVTTTVLGGFAPYTYSYYDKLTNLTVSTNNPASLPTGSYGVIITDANGCVNGSQYRADSINVNQINTFNVMESITPANCTNGSITINSISNGTPPYSQVWSNASTAVFINNLMSGYYSVSITDAANCTETFTYYVPQSVNITVPTTPTPATCTNNNGSAIAFGSGGQPPYSYLWNGIYSGQTISNLNEGYYPVVATDANGCTGQGGANIQATTPVTVTVSQTPSQCTSNTGSATLSISGGVSPYTITWNTIPVQNSTTANNLPVGNHSFHIVDVNGCIATGIVNILPVNQISVSQVSSQPTCTMSNGSINITPSGGILPYSYAWSNSATTQNISGITAGTYNVLVTDAIGCTKSKSILLNSYSPVSINLSSTPTSCIYSNDGSIVATVIGGSAPYTWVNGSANQTNLAQGYYNFYVVDNNGCTASNHTNVGCSNTSASCYCTISGIVYEDINNNCVQDVGENGIPNIQIHCNPFGYAYTNSSGYYEFKVPGGIYTISESVLAMYPLSLCQNNSNPLTVVASSSCVQQVNFANNVNPLHDLKVNLWNYNLPIPGFNYMQKLTVKNMGTVNEPSVLNTYETDGQINAATFSPSLPITLSSSNWYNNSASLMNINAAATNTFYINHSVPTNIPLSTLLTFKDTASNSSLINDWLNDYSPWDNVVYFNSLVVGSYDPNFKEVSPQGKGPNGHIYSKDSILDYMIHFQNLGNYYAQNVILLDTLDSDLDWSTLRPVDQSHPCKVTINQNGVLKIEFNNIMLPPKDWNELASQGMFSYTVKTKKNLPLGTQFTNSAAIYFDFNEPVITNTTINTLVAPDKTEYILNTASNLNIYPNPVDDYLHVEIVSEKVERQEIIICDISGKQIYKQNFTSNIGKEKVEIDTKNLSTGMYIIFLKNAQGISAGKFLKNK